MPTQTFPFTRAKSIGWAFGEILTSAQINTIDANAGQAADGLVWTDVVPARYFIKDWAATSLGLSPRWIPTSTSGYKQGYWLSFGTSSGNPTAGYSYGFGWTTGLTIPAGAGLTIPATGACATNGADGSSNVVIVGGAPGSSSTSKIRRQSGGDPTGAFTEANTVATGTIGVNCAAWHAASSLFVVGLDNTATTNIETSPDGITWTQRSAPNSTARGAMATNGSTIVCIASGSSNKCIVSSDCISWLEATLPVTTSWTDVLWSSYYQLFFALHVSNIATSPDGITWTVRAYGNNPAARLARATILGRTFVGGETGVNVIRAGFWDGGVMQTTNVGRTNSSFRAAAASTTQFLLSDTGGDHYESLRTGGTET